ncbi:hypothetical protein Tco_0816722 [Tanacetum coccineum]
MIDCLSIVETDKVNYAVETDIVKLVVEIKSFGMSSDEVDKETRSFDGLQPMQADLSYVHALNELHLHEIHVVPSKHEADQFRQPREEKKSFRQRDEKKGKSDRKCFRCDDPNHLIGDFPKPSRNKDQKAFIGGSWSDSKNDNEDKTNDETCLMAQLSNEVYLRTCLEPDEWIKDSGCSKHMTNNKILFSTYKAYDGGNVVFRSNLKGKIICKGTISNDYLTISNVEHVDNLAFNLLSVG